MVTRKKGEVTVTSEQELITPAEAAEYLLHNKCNRPLRPTLVEKYATIILNDGWKVNGEALKFDTNDDLVDGQHRLEAIVLSETPTWFTVTRGLDPEVRSTIDIGARRTMGDWFKMQGETDPVNMSTAVNWYYRLSRFNDPRIKQSDYPTYDEGWEILTQNPGLHALVKEWRRKLAMEVTGRGAMLCGILYWFEEADPVATKEFLDLLYTGANLAKGNPILALRRLLGNDRVGRKTDRKNGPHVAAAMVKAFNAWRLGENALVLAWKAEVEDFPHLLTADEIAVAKATSRS